MDRSESGSFSVESSVDYKKAVKEVTKYGFPSVCGMILRRLVDVINYLIIGQLGNPDFTAGAGLGILTMNITTFSIGVGLSGGVETLSSQAFGRKKNYLAGCYYNRAQVILTAIFIPQAIALYYSEDILIFLKQPPASSHYAGIYSSIMIPGLWMLCQTELLRRFLTTQGVLYIVVNSQILSCILHPLWVYFFVYYFDYSLEGVAYATNMTYLINFIIPILYITKNKDLLKKDSWHCINKDSFSGLLEYLEIGVPSMIMTALEVWGFEVICLMAGLLGSAQLGASVVLFNIDAFLFMIPFGFSLSFSSLVGNSLGARKHERASIYINLSVIFAIGLSAIVCFIYWEFKTQIAYMFTSDKELADLMISIFPILMLYECGNYIQCITTGIIKAMGYQKYATIVCLLSFWIVSFPVGYLLAFVWGYGLQGIFFGLPCGITVHAAIFLLIIYLTDLEELSKNIVRKIESHARGVKNYNEFNEFSASWEDSEKALSEKS
ncbi:unnamed protein product [Moneuplotes crassus]|uniref:Uncharacterized protein n=1 Tax=Euplotes crassus TaxID=5936 RepID=A0AAD1UL66_EUPCR|nr:unnamed protein product [Moneuplotes crassus]